jgi:CubicO group peptidase (beta-lactamase class C family)
MKRIVNFGLLCLAFVVASCSFNGNRNDTGSVNDRSSYSTDSLIKKISDLVEAHAELDMFSGTVLVAKNGSVIYENAVGEANKDHGVRNQLNTRYNIGSIGKTFTAVAIMQLVETGSIQLSDPLHKHLPAFPFAAGDTITIEHLLNHSSGLGDYLAHEDYLGMIPEIRGIADVIPLAYDQKPEFPAGEKFRYSNSGYLLLGAIIEKVSGLSYPAYLARNIFEPLGMTESSITYEHEVLPNRSIGYTKNGDGTYTANVLTVPAACPAGGLRTTARDLLKFDQALYGTDLLSEDSKIRMFTPSENQPGYGFGWEIKEYNGEKFVGHSGGADGIEAFFYRFVEAGYTIITLSNYDGSNGWVCSDIEAILFGVDYTLPTMYDANFALGYFLMGKKKYHEAVNVFDPNISGDNPHLMSLYLSSVCRIRGDFELNEAILDLDRYIQLADEEALFPVQRAWNDKGTIFMRLDQQEEAIRCFEKTLELDPQNAKAKERLEELRGQS